jgi:hypothetical protein
MLRPYTSEKLTIAAGRRGLERSELADEILADALAYLSISERQHPSNSASLADGVSQEANTAA